MLTLDQLNAASPQEFARLLDGSYEHSPWIVERAAAQRPFASLAALKRALVQVVDEAGLTDCTPEEFARIQRLNADYNAKFGWPFILAVRGPRGTGLTRAEIIATFERRLLGTREFEFAECLRNIHRIAQIRLNEKLGHVPRLGQLVWDWAEQLAAHSEPEYAARGQLTATYLTDAHRACAAQIEAWMRDCGFEEVGIDAVGNVVGVYAGTGDQRLLTGSHYDTVRNAGKYDGRLGFLAAMAAVRELHASGTRLPFGLEVVAFAEEEGQRYKATFLGSSALTGHFDPAWLEQRDADGVSMREAMRAAGLPGTMEAIAACKRDPARYLGFVEVHIEQGPVLDDLDLPLGIVTSINGSARYLGRYLGVASHAGTTPMNRRRDAAVAAAELMLYAESRAAADEGSVATVGILNVPSGSLNVVPGRCDFSLDLRAPNNAQRNALVADIKAQADRIATRRRVSLVLEETMVAAAAPSNPALQARWESAVSALGLPLHHLPSGAGHDAMKLHEVMRQAMLFVRGGNGGISHNPLETVTVEDAELSVRAFQALVLRLDFEDKRHTQS